MDKMIVKYSLIMTLVSLICHILITLLHYDSELIQISLCVLISSFIWSLVEIMYYLDIRF